MTTLTRTKAVMMTMVMLVSESMCQLMYDDFSSMNTWSSPSPQGDHHQVRHHHQQQQPPQQQPPQQQPPQQQPPQQQQPPKQQQQQEQEEALCRDRFGYHNRSSFLQQSCNLCYLYLFPGAAPPPPTVALNLSDGGPSGADRRLPLQGSYNETLFNETCRSMDPDDCRRWRSCCEAADECCQRQLRMSVIIGSNASADSSQCNATWDGLRCWDAAKPGSYETQFCPDYLLHSNPTRKAIKYCIPNGTWYKNDGKEWTDYRPCLNGMFYLNAVYTCLGFNALSVSTLLPSIGIFLVFRDLSKQPRIRLHINFFVSLTLCSLLTIAWYLFVHYEKLTNAIAEHTVVHRNPVWCRLISFLKTYFTSTTYFWMFCEGWYLYRLLSKAFQQPESLRSLYFIGWAMPAAAAAIYCSVRAAIDNESCWVKNVGGYEWIIYTPNLLCLVLNFIFLCRILRILLFQLHAHPQEPNNFRRGLKAGIMLIPLFGLHLLLTIYRPDLAACDNRSYEYITLAITNSQGVFVSLIFCFLNGEVISHVCRLSFCCCLSGRDRLSSKYVSHATQVTTADDRRSDTPSSLKMARRATCMGSCSGEGFCLQDMSTVSMATTAPSGGSLSSSRRESRSFQPIKSPRGTIDASDWTTKKDTSRAYDNGGQYN